MASALINSHPNQFRFLRATYQPKGHEGLLAGKASKMMRSCFPCRVEILQEYSVMPNIEQHSLLCQIRVKNYTGELRGYLRKRILEETQCYTTEPDTTCIILHNKTQLIITLRYFKESALAQLEYLCSCFHPRERRSFVCRCTPETC